MKHSYEPHRIQQKNLRPLRDSVIVSDMAFDQRQLSSGIILLNDNGKSSGIRPRWGRVYAIGPDQQDVRVGQWICVAHGRWTRGIDIEDDQGKHTIRRIDPNDILMVSDDPPGPDDTMSDAVVVAEQSR
jgi:co-chaperonin GroES (HSP10)